MAYNELVKSLDKAREYMREFYVFGFKTREEFEDSNRTYDNERRRVQNWLGDYMQYRQSIDGKHYYLSVNSREISHNPLFHAFKARSFTDISIMLHFAVLDILYDTKETLAISEIMDRLGTYWNQEQDVEDISPNTVRTLLNRYVEKGILTVTKNGNADFYSRTKDSALYKKEVLDFFSETLPCGVIGSYLLDRQDEKKDYFTFKHHYITSAIDGEILYQLFQAIGEKRWIKMEWKDRNEKIVHTEEVLPIKIFISVQNGRQYVMAYHAELQQIFPCRIDYIQSVMPGEPSEKFIELRKQFQQMLPHIWGVCVANPYEKNVERVEFAVCYGDEEDYIPQRLMREKRCGSIEKVDAHTSRFIAEVYDSRELLPWIRTFLGRITEFHCSNKEVEAQFQEELKELCKLYGIGDKNDF